MPDLSNGATAGSAETTADARILELTDRLDRLERQSNQVPLYQLPPFDYDRRVLPAANVELVAAEQVPGSTRVAIRWLKPPDQNIDHFEIWVQRTAFQAESAYQVASVADSPAVFTVTADQDTVAIAIIRTFMKSGLSTGLRDSPTVAFQVYGLSVGADELEDESVGDDHLDRTTDPVKIQNADIDRATANKLVVVEADIQDAAIKNAKIDDLAVTNAKINDLDAQKVNAGYLAAARLNTAVAYITQSAMIASATIDNAHITTLDVSKVNAGTMTVGATGLTISGNGGLDILDGGTIYCSNNIDTSAGYRVSGLQVVGSRKAAVAQVTGTADATYSANEVTMINDLKTAVNLLITRLQNHGLTS